MYQSTVYFIISVGSSPGVDERSKGADGHEENILPVSIGEKLPQRHLNKYQVAEHGGRWVELQHIRKH